MVLELCMMKEELCDVVEVRMVRDSSCVGFWRGCAEVEWSVRSSKMKKFGRKTVFL